MSLRYEIHPAIGVPRVGNSPHAFYLAPETIGGLPLACDSAGNVIDENGGARPVRKFKDDEGSICRQAARFRVFAYDDANPNDPGREITLHDDAVTKIEWTVHLANKKPVWYQGAQLDGNPMLGEWQGNKNTNSYKARQVPLRNGDITQPGERQRQLIIDPGPRSVDQPEQRILFSRQTIPPDYPHGSFPPPHLGPYPIDSLGEIMMDRDGRLVVLGAYGKACGTQIITTFTGADSWYDDISDGPVTCRLHLKNGEIKELRAWCLVGSPKWAPELVNLVSLDDLMYDVGVRYLGLVPGLYDPNRWPESEGWNPDYVANYERDIQPIIERPGNYIWVANVPSMSAFSAPKFDPRDPSEKNRRSRENYIKYWRDPGKNELGRQHEVLFAPEGIPLMPLNAGTNPVSNRNIDKMMSLTITQYKLLKQWVDGKFKSGEPFSPPLGVHSLDQASVGNCNGHPMSPGIETSWNTRNPTIYERPYRIKHRYDEAHYRLNGLSTDYDECMPNPQGVFEGCEPGDLTKRMSPPWHSDFYQCSIEYISFKDPNINQNDLTQIPPPPTYYAYWWPPQSPMYVISGAMTPQEQRAAGVVGGYQVYYVRGANNINLLITAWKYMGFIVNQNTGPDGKDYPYYVEVERNHDRFVVGSVAVSQPLDQLAASGSYFTEDNYFIPVWYLKDEQASGSEQHPRNAKRHAF